MISPATVAFIQTHLHDDAPRLLLSAPRFPGIDLRFAVAQIEARQRMKEKLPLWYDHPELILPSPVACQQASSEATARYKGRFVQEGETVIDCTGGLGVDSIAFAGRASSVLYMEQDECLCRAAQHNFNVLGYSNIEVRQGNCIDLLSPISSVHLIYIDPSRRSANQKRLFALSDCEPNILALKEMLLQKSHRVLVKISPMADIRETLRLLPETVQVEVLSVKNECKELLFLLEPPQPWPMQAKHVPIHCIHIDATGKESRFSFCIEEEEAAQASVVHGMPQGYLYEPNVSLLKGGAFKLSALRFGLQKLHPHTHLYCAPVLDCSFPGRIFRIVDVLDFNKQTIKTLHQSIPQANTAVRNFCMEAEQLRNRLKIKDGGDVYLFGVMLSNQDYALVVAKKI